MLGLRMAPRREAASWPFWLSTRAERVWHRSARICAATYWRTRNSRAAARQAVGGARWSWFHADRGRSRDKRTQFCRRSPPASAGGPNLRHKVAARKEPAGLLAKANDGLPAHVGLTLR